MEQDIVVSITKNNKFEEPQVSDIRTCWLKVKPGIEKILSENAHLTYMPEDVYSECVNGRAVLYTSPLGFVVLTIETDAFTRDKTLVVWVAYVYETGAHNWLTHIEWFEGVAKAFDCKVIEAQSAVPEFEEYFTSTGWQLETRIYIREVIDGS